MQPLATIPSPAEGVWYLGPFPLRAYALMIILGIVAAVWLGERRWTARGGTPGAVIDVAVWAVPFGLLGGRLYHVLTDWQRYFGEGGDPGAALQIWRGGLGIWGAIVLGGVGAWIGCRRRGISVLALGDAVAPGLALAQGIGRWGNWWNQELYGRPLDAWWALEIDPEHRPRLPGTNTIDPRYADVATYHPTFLYESLWCIALAFVVIWAGRRFTLTHGRTFALYVAGYTLGRFWIESLRIDEAHHILGMRLNNWTSLLVFAGAVGYLWWARNRTGPEAVVVKGAADPAAPAVPAEEASAAAESQTADPAVDRPGESGKDPKTAPSAEPDGAAKDARRPEPAEADRDGDGKDSRARERSEDRGSTDARRRAAADAAAGGDREASHARHGEAAEGAGENDTEDRSGESTGAAEARRAEERADGEGEAAADSAVAEGQNARSRSRNAEISDESGESGDAADPGDAGTGENTEGTGESAKPATTEESEEWEEGTEDAAGGADSGTAGPEGAASEEAEGAGGEDGRPDASGSAETGGQGGAGRRTSGQAAETVKD